MLKLKRLLDIIAPPAYVEPPVPPPTPEELVVAFLTNSLIEDFDRWKYKPDKDSTYYHELRHHKHGKIKWRGYVNEEDGYVKSIQAVEPYRGFELPLDGAIRKWFDFRVLHKKLEAQNAQLLADMERDQKLFDLFENLAGVKSNAHTGLVQQPVLPRSAGADKAPAKPRRGDGTRPRTRGPRRVRAPEPDPGELRPL